MTHDLYAIYCDDYRSGFNIDFYTLADSEESKIFTKLASECEIPDEMILVSLDKELFENTKYVFAIIDYGDVFIDGYIRLYKKCTTIDEALNLFLKVYSLYGNSLPFVVTGHTSSYKEKGYYPEIPDEIKNFLLPAELSKIFTEKFDIVSLVIFKIDSGKIELVKNESIKSFYIDDDYLSE